MDMTCDLLCEKTRLLLLISSICTIYNDDMEQLDLISLLNVYSDCISKVIAIFKHILHLVNVKENLPDIRTIPYG